MDSKFQLVVHASSDPGLIRVEAHGRLTELTVPKLVRVLTRAAMLDGCTLIRVDLSRLTYASARGCELLAAHIRAHGRQPLVVIDSLGLDESVARRLDIKHLPVRHLELDEPAEVESSFEHRLRAAI